MFKSTSEVVVAVPKSRKYVSIGFAVAAVCVIAGIAIVTHRIKKIISERGVAPVSAAENLSAGKFRLGDKIPDFTFTDAEGKKSSLGAALDGEHFVAIVFTHPDCPCAASCGRLISEMQGEGYNKDVRVLGFLSSGVDNERVLNALAAQQKNGEVTYPVAIDRDKSVRKIFEPKRTPEMWVLDKEGRIAFYGAPENTLFPGSKGHRYLLREAIDALRAGKQPEIRRYDPIGCPIED